MSHKRRSFTPEYKEQVARMVVEESQAIPSTAREIGVNEQTLRNWVHGYRRDHAGEEPPWMRCRSGASAPRDSHPCQGFPGVVTTYHDEGGPLWTSMTAAGLWV